MDKKVSKSNKYARNRRDNDDRYSKERLSRSRSPKNRRIKSRSRSSSKRYRSREKNLNVDRSRSRTISKERQYYNTSTPIISKYNSHFIIIK